MKKLIVCSLMATSTLVSPMYAHAGGINMKLIGTYKTGLANPKEKISSAETVALRDGKLFATNANDVSLDIVDVRNPAQPALLKRVDLKPYGSSVNSVDVSANGLVAIAVNGQTKTANGSVVFLDAEGNLKQTATVGAGPDMVVFTTDGKRLLVANEGEPDCYGQGCVDPEGSVSVIEIASADQAPVVHTIGFSEVKLPEGVRMFGPGATPAQDIEPEYIALSIDSKTAWVSLQENNAIAKLDLETMKVSDVFALGYKDHGKEGHGLDVSDKDGKINIKTWTNVRGMYMPDAIAHFMVDGKSYLVSANEGDARDYKGFAEEARVIELSQLSAIKGADDKKNLGRLTVTNTPPNNDFSHAYAFGGRSISVWDGATGEQMWDSGDQLEQYTARALPNNFNSNNDKNDSYDTRSDNKGPEPEAVAIGKLGDRTFAFVGLERTGGLAVFDITDPKAPVYQRYITSRYFSVEGSDSGPEIVRFVDAASSPDKQPMVVVANEVSGTVNFWRVALKP